MAALQDKIKKVLDECRILILGAQVLLGVQFRAVFESGFDKISSAAKISLIAGIGLLSIALALLWFCYTLYRSAHRVP